MSEVEPKIYTKAYHGPATERNSDSVKKELEVAGIRDFDDLVMEQVVPAKRAGRHLVTVVDIGCGKKAQLFRHYMDYEEPSHSIRGLNNTFREVGVRLVGITDAQLLQNLGGGVDFREQQLGNISITSELVEYTITRKQDLEKLYRRIGIDQINLALATWSLAYLSPRVFEQVVVATTERLSVGGRFIGRGYHEPVSGMGFIYDAKLNAIYLKPSYTDVPPTIWQDLFIKGKNIKVSDEQRLVMIDYFVKVIGMLDKNDYIAPEQSFDWLQSLVEGNISIYELRILAADLQHYLLTYWADRFRTRILPAKNDFLMTLEKDQRFHLETDYDRYFTIKRVV